MRLSRQNKILEIIRTNDVETQEQLDFLSSIDCDIVQGYYYSRPVPPDEFEVFMERYR